MISPKHLFHPGQVVFSKIRPYLKKAFVARFSGACSADMYPLDPRVCTDAAYLKWWLNSEEFVTFVAREQGRTLLPKVNQDGLNRTPLPLPPPAEQRRIVAKLDALSARSKRAKAELERVEALAERARQAIVAEAFGRKRADVADLMSWDGPYSLPPGWQWKSAAEVVEAGADIVYGIVQPGPRLSEGVPYVRGTDIEGGTIKIDQLLRTSREIANRYSRACLRGGDVLLGIIRATKVAIVPDELEGANITQGTARLRPSSSILPQFLALWLQGPVAQGWLRQRMRGIDMPGLNLRDVRRCPVPLPSIQEQTSVLERLNSRLQSLKVACVGASTVASHLERLDRSILSKAFRGELVPQDPADEPASVVLERIRAERVGSDGPTKRRRKAVQD
ncbi:restriction endonuclease subunit S [Chthonobacter rhizosphaerae]|uniref:restriction endonuclease subunit S n=1 Tax=Chthonobacter rhizosphaerae TaxID=2735553 RepID=UPI0015EF5F3C